MQGAEGGNAAVSCKTDIWPTPEMKLHQGAGIASRLATAAFVFICGSILVVRPARPRADTTQAPSNSPRKALTVSKLTSAETPMPFRTGEILNYRVEWAIFPTAAVLQMSVIERRNLLGWQTWHFRASAHSVVPARTFFEVDDQFDSYTDATTLESHQYEMYLNEMGSKENEVLHLVAIGQASRGNFTSVIVQPGTRDPLGAFYALRAADWQQTPEFHVPVYDGSDLYDVRAPGSGIGPGRGGCREFSSYENFPSAVRARQRSAAHRFPGVVCAQCRAHARAGAGGDACGKCSCGIGKSAQVAAVRRRNS